ncbi:hypothetical protein PMIN01_05328 [Paraphaeosphaeria minitans]|uniref:Uncharacterized protein n=1 Tax=Paraphaeosphaeria minitans TaxID=565426 RepID=A0A9P6GLD9_9PLEO|nr:hypothetical protein PMIN01_05328 [Paraphaeosphaeria minitans]
MSSARCDASKIRTRPRSLPSAYSARDGAARHRNRDEARTHSSKANALPYKRILGAFEPGERTGGRLLPRHLSRERVPQALPSWRSKWSREMTLPFDVSVLYPGKLPDLDTESHPLRDIMARSEYPGHLSTVVPPVFRRRVGVGGMCVWTTCLRVR